MKQILVFPTWIIMRLSRPFLSKNHSLKRTKITLEDWSKYSTKLNDKFSYIFWIQILFIITLVFL